MLDRYEELYRNFRWDVPQRYNIARACCGQWAADANRTALYWEDESGATATHSFRDIQLAANRLSNGLTALGVKRGDRVAIVLPQRPETAVAYMAVFQMGAIALPLSHLFGPDALEYRINHAEATVAIVEPATIANLWSIKGRLATLKHVIGVAGASETGVLSFDSLVQKADSNFTCVETLADDPALIIYTSGTTGAPKGALEAHRLLIGNLSGFVHSHDFFPQPGDLFWSPADWAWAGGLFDALLPTWAFGLPILGYRGKFDAEKAYHLIDKYGIRNSFLFTTALKLMMKAVAEPRKKHRLNLRSIMSAGESVGVTVIDWARAQLGVTINEMFGQTEINYVVGNCQAAWPVKPGSIGRPYPGHRVAFIDDRAVTGDQGKMDHDGYLWYQGRSDDLIKSAGYRIGPSEIESCLVRHPAVANAAVIGKPDATRGAIVKAFIVLQPGQSPSQALIDDLQQHVRGRLAPYEYPREIEFIAALPMTTTGKVQRKELRKLEAAKLKTA